jgi:hypothetical protein
MKKKKGGAQVILFREVTYLQTRIIIIIII